MKWSRFRLFENMTQWVGWAWARRWFVKMEEAAMDRGNSKRHKFGSCNSQLPMGHKVTYLSSLFFNFLTYKNTDHIALLLGYGDPKPNNDALVSIWHVCSQIDFPAGHISLWPFEMVFVLLQNTKCLFLSGINQRTSVQCLLANEKENHHPQHSEEIQVLVGALKYIYILVNCDVACSSLWHF